MNFVEAIFNLLRNKTLNSLGVERDLMKLIQDKDISQVQTLLQNRDMDVIEAMEEYNPETHKVNKRKDKQRKNKEPYRVEKLPRTRQRYINEVELFFLLGNPIKWKNDVNGTDEAFKAYNEFLQDTRFHTTMRQAKRLAGSETESAKIYHIYDDNGKPGVKVLVISKSKGYTLRPLFDQYENLIAFGYGYNLKEGDRTIEHFDIETPAYIFRCKKANIGWEVTPLVNPSGKINVIYYRQDKAWYGTQPRCDREEHIDSKAADTNNYFADPKLKATADVIQSLAEADTAGEVIRMSSKDNSSVEYLAPPEYSSMKDSEKKDLNNSILFDSFTPDFSFENMKGMGTLSGEALKRAMTLGYIKRDNLKEIYDILVDREKNLILAIMMNVTHIHLREQLAKMNITHEFAEPFNEDKEKLWASIGKLYSDGIISLDLAVNMLALTDAPQEEIERIKNEKLDSINVGLVSESVKKDNI
ncbi:phage portal protein [Bacteroides congonensis]